MGKKVIIAGAGGRDFHDYLVLFKDNPDYEVVCFTAAQIPFIEKRHFPASLAGNLYPKGIPIFSEKLLTSLIKKHDVDLVYLAYSDLSNQDILEKASEILAAGATFVLESPKETMLKSKKPVISVCAIRTGCGKSAVSRYVAKYLTSKGRKVAVLRHPMPYSKHLETEEVQRFATFDDLDEAKVTIEEREEYEPHITNGSVVFAGVDYKKILSKAEKEADVIIWDGGNNDTPFIKPDLHIVLVDPHRPGNELTYYPGLINLKMADAIIISKVRSAKKENVALVEKNSRLVNPLAAIIHSDLKITADNPKLIRNKNVLLIADGPSITHGGLKFGAATVVAEKYKAKKIIDARKFAVGTLKDTYMKYPNLGHELPAMGYSNLQLRDLEKTINNVKCDVVIDGSPANLGRILKINHPMVNVNYEFEEIGKYKLDELLSKF